MAPRPDAREQPVGVEEDERVEEEFLHLWTLWEALFKAGENPGNAEAGAALLEDERKFIDLARSPLWFNEEHVIVG